MMNPTDPEDDRSGTRVWLVLMKAHRTLWRHATRSIEAAGMCLSDFAVLELVLHRGPQPVNTIGRRIDLSSGAITAAVDRLERRGLVARGHVPDDRRTRLISLTPDGRTLITGVFGDHRQAMDRAAAGLTEDERGMLIMLLKKLGLAAEQQLAEAGAAGARPGGTDHDEP